MSSFRRSPLNLLLTLSLLLSMSIGVVMPVSARPLSLSNQAGIDLMSMVEPSRIHNISTNAADYPDGKIPRYEKFEITFQVDTQAKNLQMPYDETPPAGVKAKIGINVDAQFSSDNWRTAYTVPGFYYQEFDHQVKQGKDWIYPTESFAWKVRFAPNREGKWQYKLLAKDADGNTPPIFGEFEVVSSTNHGFVRVSKDPRYFEFEDGTYFPGLGYNMTYGNDLDMINPVLSNQPKFAAMSADNVQLLRMWLSGWSIYGSAWNPWRTSGNDHIVGSYLPQTGLTPFKTAEGEYKLQLQKPDASDKSFVSHYRLASDREKPAVLSNTSYLLSITYRTYGLPEVPGTGFITKIPNEGCGTAVSTSYAYTNTGIATDKSADVNFAILTATWQSGSCNFLPNLDLMIENVDKGRAFVDDISLQQILPAGGLGPNVMTKPDMDHHLYFAQRNSYAFDQVVDLANANDIYLKLVTIDKWERTLTQIEPSGTISKTESLLYFYAAPNTKVRWLQQAWWRYLQARWGYSTNIHSWELLNEGESWKEHYELANTFAGYMHQFEANKHLVTTSFYGNSGTPWVNFPTDCWNKTTTVCQNLDYADLHEYVDYHLPVTDTVNACGWEPKFASLWTDSANNTVQYSTNLSQFTDKKVELNKPLMRGEVGWIFYAKKLSNGKEECAPIDNDLDFSKDDPTTNGPHAKGVWLHNLLWGGINPGGMIESYWAGAPTQNHIYSQGGSGHDYRSLYKAYYNFIKDIPLNNGRYSEVMIETSNSALRVLGQMDSSAGQAHLWIQNSSHIWTNVARGVADTLQSGFIDVKGLQPSGSYVVERWKTYTDVQQITEQIVAAADISGTLRIEVTDLKDDVAVKLYPSTAPYKMVAKVQGPNALKVDFIEKIEPLDRQANTFVLAIPNIGRTCGGGTPLSIWKVTVDPTTQLATNVTHKQMLDQIQIVRGAMLEASDGTLFTGGGWCGNKPPYFSTDSGETWRSADSGDDHPTNSTFSYAELNGRVYAGTDSSPDLGAVYRWLGNGKWEKVFTLPTSERSVVTSMAIYQNQLFIAAGFYTGGLDRVGVPVYLSTDGNTFMPTSGIPSTYHPWKLLKVGNRLVAMVQGANAESEEYVYLWEPTAKQWRQIANYSGNWQWTHFGGSPNVVSYGNSIYAYGHATNDAEWGMYRSDNLGISWQQLFPFGTRKIPAMAIYRNRLYFSSEADANGVAYLYQIELPLLGKAQIAIVKDALPDSPRNFHYFGPWGDFYLDDPGQDDGDTIKNSMRYTDVPALGTYSFSEEKVANWFMTDIQCNPTESAMVNLLQRSVTINPNPGERVTCTFINKYAASLSVYSYWDMDQDGQHDPTEDWQDGWWTEFYDSSGNLKASNFTQNGGHWDLYNIRPGTYTVCQKPQAGWNNTKPIITDPAHNNWPCYTFDLSYAQMAKAYFGYSDQPFVANADEQSAQSGLEIIQVSDLEQDALATWEEFLAAHPGDRLPDEDDVNGNIYLPMIAR